MTKKDILKIFKDKGAIQEGHFLLTSGLHSTMYVQSAIILQYPRIARRICTELARRFSNRKIDVVVSPAVGGIIVGHEVARVFNARAVYAEREKGRMQLRRGFRVNRGERVLLVENVVTTGSSISEVVGLVREQRGILVGVGALVNRAKRRLKFNGKEMKSLIDLEIPNFTKGECPFCKKNIPYKEQGSRWIKKRKKNF